MVDVWIDLTQDYHAGTINARLAQLPQQLDQVAEQAVNETADFVVTMAKILVRVDTGTLQKTIRKERGGVGLGWREMRVRAGGYFTNPKTNKICDYATHVERNSPFLGPAAAMAESFLKTQIRTGILERVQ